MDKLIEEMIERETTIITDCKENGLYTRKELYKKLGECAVEYYNTTKLTQKEEK